MSNALLQQAAEQLLAQYSYALPDLRNLVVILPNYHVAKPFAQALCEISGVPALLLPQMTTLSDWAQTVPIEQHIQPDTQRMTTLYQALRQQNWFEQADLWGLARDLLSIIDELTAHYVALPETSEEFAEQLSIAYQARNHEPLQFEAKVVHELWYIMSNGEEISTQQAYQFRLARLASQVELPIFALITSELSTPECRFLNACSQLVAVDICDLRALILNTDAGALLSLTIRSHHSIDLRQTAVALHDQIEGELTDKVRLFGAHSLEQEAHAADVQIRRWLLAGKSNIAVVVLDRLVARRTRALLERAQIQVLDETGWTFATLSVSTVLMRWLDAIQSDFYYHDVVDLLKSPFVFADISPAERKRMAYLFEQMTRKHSVLKSIDSYLEVAERTAPDLVTTLARLRQAAHVIPKRNATIYEWMSALFSSLDTLSIIPAWQQDAAGQQLLQLFHQWREELKQDTTRCSISEWRRWLSQQFDSNTFRDHGIDSSVIFTHLPATRWRQFDAVILLGCDEKHLPNVSMSKWFNDAVRQSLGLPINAQQQAQICDDLLGLIGMHDTIFVTWQASKNGEPNLLSPCLAMLNALHHMAYQKELYDTQMASILEYAHIRSADELTMSATQVAKPSVPEQLIPKLISASGYNSLIACPYQYYARYMLKLNELDEIREDLDKRDYGIWIHRTLQLFHQQYPEARAHTVESLTQSLLQVSETVFGDKLNHNYLTHAWLQRWIKQIPRYIDWQIEHEQSGWKQLAIEQYFDVDIDENLRLQGRVDRIDTHTTDQETIVLDYKTQTATRLKSKLKHDGEDVQLACYAYGMNAQQAAFVSIDDKVESVSVKENFAELTQQNIERLKIIFQQIRQHAQLPAQGVEQVCQSCEMAGICRQAYVDAVVEVSCAST